MFRKVQRHLRRIEYIRPDQAVGLQHAPLLNNLHRAILELNTADLDAGYMCDRASRGAIVANPADLRRIVARNPQKHRRASRDRDAAGPCIDLQTPPLAVELNIQSPSLELGG